MRNNFGLQGRLEQLGLTSDEALIFLELLNTPKTHLEVSRVTGIARSNVYRIVDGMINKGLVSELTSYTGKVLAAAQPEALELLVVEQEQLAQQRRTGLSQLLPLLAHAQRKDNNFSIITYAGLAGVKQMLWNELKAKSEILYFSGDSLEAATGRHWAEKFRAEFVDRKLSSRGIENARARNVQLSAYTAYTEHYQARYLSEDLLDIHFEMSVYDDTVCIYNSLAHDVYMGTEIKNPFLARFMRQIFEHYWTVAKP